LPITAQYIQVTLFNFKEKHRFDVSTKEPFQTGTLIFDRLMFQIQIYIIVALLLCSGAVSGDLQKVLRLAKFIADIYQQFPQSRIFIITSEAKQQDEN
jgi:hypothetical protein